METPTRKSSNVSIKQIVTHIEKGNYRVPKFQREFEWTAEDVCSLVVSILKDLNIGQLMLWESQNDYDCRDFGGFFEQPKGGNHYVLDGHQKLTALYLITKNKGYGQSIFLNLDAYKLYQDTRNPSIQFAFVGKSVLSTNRLIAFSELFDSRFESAIEKDEELIAVRNRFLSYKMNVVSISGSVNYAVEQFVATNTSGKDLTVLSILGCKFVNDMHLEDMMYNLHNRLTLSTTISFVDGCQPLKLLLDTRYAISKSQMYKLDASTVLARWNDLVTAYCIADDLLTKKWKLKKIQNSRYMYHVIAYYFFYSGYEKVEEDHEEHIENLINSAMFALKRGAGAQDNINSHLQNNFQMIETLVDDGILDYSILSKK